MDYRPAEFVRVVLPDERLEEVVNEAKADTWVRGREHAVLGLADGTLIMVRVSRDGITLVQDADETLWVDVANRQTDMAHASATHGSFGPRQACSRPAWAGYVRDL